MARLDDLDDDCLLMVLDRLPPDEFLKLQRLNKRMKRLAGIKMRVKVVAISLWGSNKFFSNFCDHLGVVTRDQMLGLVRALASTNSKSEFIIDALNRRAEKATSAIGRTILLDVFSRCNNIKSIDFELPGDLLLEVVKLCPEIECIKFGWLIEEDEWSRVCDLIGHRLVHVVKVDNDASEQVWLFTTVAEKCPNIKQIDWHTKKTLISDWMAAIKRLPNSCRVKINCFSFSEDSFEDVVDELSVICWPLNFNRRTERLSTLKLFYFHRNSIGADFAGLKKLIYAWSQELSYSTTIKHNRNLVNFLVASQFPRLEEFCFNVSVGLEEEDYETMFGRVATVKRLTLVCEYYLRLPRSAICQLKKLETIVFEMKHVPVMNQEDELLQQLEQYIEDIDLLKKVVIEPNYDSSEKSKWQQAFKDGIERLKREQSRVAVEFQP